MTIKHLFPPAFPSLNLDFANELALDPRITYSRASTGTYVDAKGILQTAQVDEPRFDYDGGTGKSLGLLLEEARTNLSEFSVPDPANGWVENAGTLTPSAATAPDGTSTAASFIEDTSSNQHYTTLDKFDGVTGNTYTSSVFIKANGRTKVRLGRLASVQVGTISNGAWNDVIVDLTAGTITSTTTDTTINKLANGWFRVSASYTMTADSNNTNLLVYLLDDAGNIAYTGDGTSGIFIWGGQSEEGVFPTSLIPSAGAAVTRDSDTVSMEGTSLSSWFTPAEGTVYSEAISLAPTSYTTSQLVWHFRNPGRKEHNARGSFQFYDTSGYNSSIATYVQNVPTKAIFGFKTDDARCALNGTLGTLSTTWSPTDHTSLFIGSNNTENQFFFGHIQRFAFYTTRLPDSQLVALTS